MPKIVPIPMTSFDSDSLTANYQLLGDALPHECNFLRVKNGSGVEIIISFDGVTDHEAVLADSETILPFYGKEGSFKAGSALYVKGTESSTGLIYLSGYYLS